MFQVADNVIRHVRYLITCMSVTLRVSSAEVDRSVHNELSYISSRPTGFHHDRIPGLHWTVTPSHRHFRIWTKSHINYAPHHL